MNETHLILIRRYAKHDNAVTALAIWSSVLGPTANPRVVALGPGRKPWGVVVEAAAVEAAESKLSDNARAEA